MAPYEALYDRRCHSLVGWFDPGEVSFSCADLVCDTLDKVKLIHERPPTSQSKQKRYTDMKDRDVAYMVGEKVLLRVSPMKGVMRFGKKSKLSPRYIGPFEKYYGDPSYVLDFRTVQLDGDESENVKISFSQEDSNMFNQDDVLDIPQASSTFF
ncbi:uncharacterized protein [Nicotiana sylvestris]|uniref:uncharacterized protein n=1 Tax=Nicotiana sylvestris TaxID=4096 RepID=UPI00388C5634